METPRAVPGSAAHRWDGLHCSFTMERPARGIVVLRIAGHDVGEFGDAPLRALEGYLSADGTIMLFIDARHTEGASIEVSGAWAQWLAAHRARCARIAMLPGSRFIEVTARFVRSFAELDAVMRLYSDAAAFDRDLGEPSPRRTPRRHSERRAFRPRVEKRKRHSKKKSSSEGPENVRSRHHFRRKIPITDGFESAKSSHLSAVVFERLRNRMSI